MLLIKNQGFFSSLPFFCFFTNINNLSIHAHDDCSWPGSKSHFFWVVGYNWRVSGMFGGEYHITLVYFSGLVPQRIFKGGSRLKGVALEGSF